MAEKYNHREIEEKWQKRWEEARAFETPDTKKGTKNFYLLTEFPYPSGSLHVGHWYAFSVPDILARYLRMKGKNVLFPIGFDAFGLPAENAAIERKLNPRTWTNDNISHMREQVRSMGATFDWSREVVTCDPAYYKWTQWMFVQFFKKGLAYRKETAVNWCPKDKTVLANEQVLDGRCERCGTEVEQRQMPQWNLKITDYADRLIDDLEPLPWPKAIKDAQVNWIGRSEGAEVDFPLKLESNKKYKFVILHGFHARPFIPRWQWLKRELEKDGHEVIIPALPRTDWPSEEPQVRTALECTTYDENTVLIGHSLGGVVAMKVAEKLRTKIARLVLIGTPTDSEFKDKHRNFEKRFVWKFDSERIKRNVHSVTILHDSNDYAVTEAHRMNLERMFGIKAELCRPNEPHFTADKEPEILRWLRPTITVFTTRPDTLFGATYLVLSPEYSEISNLKPQISNWKEVEKYINKAKKKTEIERAENKEKTGVELRGVKAINPATKKEIPIYVADYVLSGYGTGAIMGVPAHDERDFEFAQKFNLPVRRVMEPKYVGREEGAPQPGQEFVKRNAVCVVLRNPKDDTYLCNVWKTDHMHGLLTGGVEDGEDMVEAALREIREETGYKNVKFVDDPNWVINTFFYHRQKRQNRWARFRYLFFELKNEERDPVDAGELAKHEFVWKKKGELKDFFSVFEGRFLVTILDNPNYVYVDEGYLTNSGEFNGLPSEEAKKKITEFVGGKMTKTYKLRDWVVSRQRYWGVPIPMIECKKCGWVPVPEEQLPVLLPEIDDYLPRDDGRSPLAKKRDFVEVKCPQCGGSAERETDTLDTFVDSSWYFLRYTDPKDGKEFAAKGKMKNWMPVNLYSGGSEHTTMHLLYSRFWHKALYDLGLVGEGEPYVRRMNRGLIMGSDGRKMSKRWKNVVDPDKEVARVGADAVRTYLAFIGPYNEVGAYPWQPGGITGVRRFLEKVWKLQARTSDVLGVPDVQTLLHQTIKKVSEDIESLKMNTAVSALMILTNRLAELPQVPRDSYKILLKLLAPFAPHIAHELAERVGFERTEWETWPSYDPQKLAQATVTVAVQVNGKTRGSIELTTSATEAEALAAARGSPAVAKWLAGKEKKVVYIPGKIINLVV